MKRKIGFILSDIETQLETIPEILSGLDRFAIAALHGLINGYPVASSICKEAYRVADMMIEESNKL